MHTYAFKHSCINDSCNKPTTPHRPHCWSARGLVRGGIDSMVNDEAFAERREPSVAMAVDDDDVWVGIAS